MKGSWSRFVLQIGCSVLAFAISMGSMPPGSNFLAFVSLIYFWLGMDILIMSTWAFTGISDTEDYIDALIGFAVSGSAYIYYIQLKAMDTDGFIALCMWLIKISIPPAFLTGAVIVLIACIPDYIGMFKLRIKKWISGLIRSCTVDLINRILDSIFPNKNFRI